jgi:nucleoside-diphosphate-sugar epimerase
LRTLVIGSSGFIGAQLVDALIQGGLEVLGMDLRRPDEDGPFAFCYGDVRSRSDLRRAAAGADLIINLAAQHRDFGVSREAYFAVNDAGTRNVVETATELGITRHVYFSSVAVYRPDGTATEETPFGSGVPYGESKVAGERHVMQWAAASPHHQAIIIRPCVVFGPRNYGNMYNLIRTIAARRFVMVGDGGNVKSVAYVENLADATLFVLKRIRPGLDIYNYSDYPHMTASELVSMVSRSLGISPPALRLPLGPTLAAARIMDVVAQCTGYDLPITANRIRKLNTSTVISSDKIRALGFSQRVPIDQAIALTTAWYKQQRKAATA